MDKKGVLIFVFSVIGLFFIVGCSQYFGQEARGQSVGEPNPDDFYSSDYQDIGQGVTVPATSISGDFNKDGCVEVFTTPDDVLSTSVYRGRDGSEFIDKYSKGDLTADIDNNGNLDSDDIFLFLNNAKKYPCTALREKAKKLVDYNRDGCIDAQYYPSLQMEGREGIIFYNEYVKARTDANINGDGSVDGGDYQLYIDLLKDYACKIRAEPTTPSRGDFNGDGCIDAKSVDGNLKGEDGEVFVNFFSAGDKGADINGNGIVEAEDIFKFAEWSVLKYACKQQPEKEDLLQKLDADDNGVIDNEDFFLFSAAFGTSDLNFDYDNDGDVDIDDYLLFADNFGTKVS